MSVEKPRPLGTECLKPNIQGPKKQTYRPNRDEVSVTFIFYKY
jgi:hypothetical protein